MAKLEGEGPLMTKLMVANGLSGLFIFLLFCFLFFPKTLNVGW